MKSIVFILSCFISLSACKTGGRASKDAQASVVDSSSATVLSGESISVDTSRRSIEDSLKWYSAKIYSFRGAWAEELDMINKNFLSYLEKICRYRSVLEYSFDNLETPGFWILTSEDGKLRIFNWDSQGGGTWRFYNAIAQFETNNGCSYKILNDVSIPMDDGGSSGVAFDTIFTVVNQRGKIYYLPVSTALYSSNGRATGIESFTIENDTINESSNIFITPDSAINYLTFEYDYFSSYDPEMENRTNWVRFDDKRRELSVPVVKEGLQMTSRSLIYKFNGDKFVYQGIK